VKHLHLMIRGRGRAALSSNEAVGLLHDIVSTIGMKIAPISGNPLVYDCSIAGNEGVTVAMVIETSNITLRSYLSDLMLHTWSHSSHKLTLYQFDLFSCAYFEPVDVCRFLKDRLDLVSFEQMLIDRTVGLERC
jgi:S-adenosylmethionine/arginine decarboxylase-like enzyme